MTELLRNFWIRQSLPWIAITNQMRTVEVCFERSHTGIRDLSNLVTIVTVPRPMLVIVLFNSY